MKQLYFTLERLKMNPIRPMYLLHSRSGHLSVFQLFVIPLNFDIVVVLVKLSGISCHNFRDEYERLLAK